MARRFRDSINNSRPAASDQANTVVTNSALVASIHNKRVSKPNLTDTPQLWGPVI